MPDFGIFRGFGSKLFSDKLYAGQLPTQLGLIGSLEINLALLDIYPNAAAAYSLRKLRTAYTGSAIRVRRASDNTEQDIGFVNNVLDTSSLTSFCSGTNGFVKTWYDQSGNGYDATQTTAASQPQIVSSGVVNLENGKPAIRFGQGQLTYLDNASFTDYQTAYTVTRFITRPSFAYILTQGNNYKIISDISGQSYRLYNGTNLYSGVQPSLTSQDLIYALFNGVNSEIAVDGGSKIIGNPGINFPTTLRIGSSTSNFIDSTLNGFIQEIILYNSNQSSNRTGIESNINSFYSIY